VTDIFISYARADRAFANALAHALEQRGFKVWWDWDLIGGTNYRTKIRDVIGESNKAVVLWSRHSVESAFVIDEASEAKKLGKLIPVSIDGSEPPFGFGDLHTIVLKEPKLDIEALVAAIEDRAPARAPSVDKSRRRLGKVLGAGLAALCVCAVAAGAYWTLNRPAREAATPRIALVIGNSNYLHFPTLANAVSDAEKVAIELERRGFKVIKELNLTNEAMTKVLSEFESTLSIVGGVGVFYYAGSAAYVDGEDIMLPIDVSADMEKKTIHNGVNFTRLQQEIQSRITHRIKDNGVAMIYSASKGQFASDGPAGGNSPFTTAFVHALSAANDDLNDMFRRIRSVMDAEQRNDPTALKQTPWFENQLKEKFYFGRSEGDVASGVSKILIFDSCRDNPFAMKIATK
jgi:hypothetical protein